jgi:hypothetical protein
MGLFDAFTFKKESGKVFSKENFKELFQEARSHIIELAKENIPGEEKKRALDTLLTTRVYMKVSELKVKNKIVLWLVDRFVEILPTITQLIYEFLKEKVESL